MKPASSLAIAATTTVGFLPLAINELYTSLEQQALLAAWKMGSTTEEKIRRRFEPKTKQIAVHGYLLEYD